MAKLSDKLRKHWKSTCRLNDLLPTIVMSGIEEELKEQLREDINNLKDIEYHLYLASEQLSEKGA